MFKKVKNDHRNFPRKPEVASSAGLFCNSPKQNIYSVPITSDKDKQQKPLLLETSYDYGPIASALTRFTTGYTYMKCDDEKPSQHKIDIHR